MSLLQDGKAIYFLKEPSKHLPIQSQKKETLEKGVKYVQS